MTPSTTPFPRTKAEVSSAPWCDNIDDDRSFGGDLIFIEVRYDWLPEKFPVSNFCSARGETFKEALADLRDPTTGAPVSRTPVDWEANGFPERVPSAPAQAGE